MQDAVIVAAARTAVGKAPNGALRTVRPDEMAATVISEVLRRAPGLDPHEIDDVMIGCAMPEAEQGLNVARIASLRAGVPVEASAVTINRFCSSGLEAIATAGERIMCGFARAVVAGGTESMSLIPMGGNKVSPNPALVDSYPDVYLSTGLVAENHARESGVSREEQDAFALRSHQRAVAAIDAGRFRDEIVPLAFRVAVPRDAGRAPEIRDVTFTVDEGPRRDTSADALARLRPAFHVAGTVTAGNSSQTSDGAAAVIVTSSAFARERSLQPLARLVTYATAGVEPERFGIGPVPAIRKALTLAGLQLDQIDLVELNEAFAAQVLACLRELPIDPERLNVNGGAIALGHPLGCTGAKLTTSILYEMQRRHARYGMVTMCVGGGMGAAAIFENVSNPKSQIPNPKPQIPNPKSQTPNPKPQIPNPSLEPQSQTGEPARYVRIRENLGSAARLSTSGRPSSLRTMLAPCTSDTIL
jgi:acetyl-CoA acyltransferase